MLDRPEPNYEVVDPGQFMSLRLLSDYSDALLKKEWVLAQTIYERELAKWRAMNEPHIPRDDPNSRFASALNYFRRPWEIDDRYDNDNNNNDNSNDSNNQISTIVVGAQAQRKLTPIEQEYVNRMKQQRQQSKLTPIIKEGGVDLKDKNGKDRVFLGDVWIVGGIYLWLYRYNENNNTFLAYDNQKEWISTQYPSAGDPYQIVDAETLPSMGKLYKRYAVQGMYCNIKQGDMVLDTDQILCIVAAFTLNSDGWMLVDEEGKRRVMNGDYRHGIVWIDEFDKSDTQAPIPLKRMNQKGQKVGNTPLEIGDVIRSPKTGIDYIVSHWQHHKRRFYLKDQRGLQLGGRHSYVTQEGAKNWTFQDRINNKLQNGIDIAAPLTAATQSSHNNSNNNNNNSNNSIPKEFDLNLIHAHMKSYVSQQISQGRPDLVDFDYIKRYPNLLDSSKVEDAIKHGDFTVLFGESDWRKAQKYSWSLEKDHDKRKRYDWCLSFKTTYKCNVQRLKHIFNPQMKRTENELNEYYEIQKKQVRAKYTNEDLIKSVNRHYRWWQKLKFCYILILF